MNKEHTKAKQEFCQVGDDDGTLKCSFDNYLCQLKSSLNLNGTNERAMFYSVDILLRDLNQHYHAIQTQTVSLRFNHFLIK